MHLRLSIKAKARLEEKEEGGKPGRAPRFVERPSTCPSIWGEGVDQPSGPPGALGHHVDDGGEVQGCHGAHEDSLIPTPSLAGGGVLPPDLLNTRREFPRTVKV